MCTPSRRSSDADLSEFTTITPRSTPSSPLSNNLESEQIELSTDLTGGAGGPGGTGHSNNNGDDGSGPFRPDDDDSAPADPEQLSAILAENKATIADIPKEILNAYNHNIIPVWAISNYLAARANPLSRVMLAVPSMRDRFLADKLFLLKILIEEGIGLFGKLSAEFEQRRSRFWNEGEFVLTNVIIALLADFGLVYYPAPSLSLVRNTKQSWLQSLSSTLPSNVFQTDRPFTLVQRAGGFFFKFSQLFTVGFVCCFSGVVITNGLVYIREKVDPSYKPETTKQSPFLMSCLYALFLGASSGTRYQLVNGIESHIFPRLFATTPALVEQVATFGLRFGNTFWGSQQWVMFARLTNVQKVKETVQSEPIKADTPGSHAITNDDSDS